MDNGHGRKFRIADGVKFEFDEINCAHLLFFLCVSLSKISN